MARVGKIIETQRSDRKLSFEWRIPDFFRWVKMNGRYQRAIPSYPKMSGGCLSPTFGFYNDIWTVTLYTDDDYELAYVKLYFYTHEVEGDERCLYREDDDTYRTVCYEFAIKDANGRAVLSIDCEQDFTPGGSPVLSWADFWPLYHLRKHKSTLVPDNVFTVMCTFESRQRIRISLPHEYLRVYGSPKYLPNEEADFILKVGNREWPVHKRILASSSEYFASMFRRDWSENSDGWVRFDDVKEDVLDWVLKFVYDGAIEDLLLERVWDIYVAADKFLLSDLKTTCIEAIQEEMGPDVVWEALAFAKIYGEKALKENVAWYLSSEEVWNACLTGLKRFKENHPSIAAEVLEEIKNKDRSAPDQPTKLKEINEW